MTAQQRIVRVRRNYNQWVANQTLEDYALRFTAKTARRWSSLRVANTAIGAVSFLALEAIGGSITVNYGFVNASIAIVVVALTGTPMASPDTKSSTLRFCCRPEELSFEATGRVFPKPLAETEFVNTPS